MNEYLVAYQQRTSTDYIGSEQQIQMDDGKMSHLVKGTRENESTVYYTFVEN